MEPVYRNIEFVSDFERLWGKMSSGRWDWLGVRKDGQFVLGSPRRAKRGMTASLTVVHEGADQRENGVAVHWLPDRSPSWDWWPTAPSAREGYRNEIAKLKASANPLLARVELIRGGTVIEQEWVLVNVPTYGVWRPPPPA